MKFKPLLHQPQQVSTLQKLTCYKFKYQLSIDIIWSTKFWHFIAKTHFYNAIDPDRQPQRWKAGKIPAIMQRCNFRFHKIIKEGTDITVLIKFKTVCQGPCAITFVWEQNNIWLGKKEIGKWTSELSDKILGPCHTKLWYHGSNKYKICP